MIEINLLPDELKSGKKGFELDSRYVVFIIPLLLILLVPVNIVMGVIAGAKGAELTGLNRKWAQLAPQRQALDSFKKETDLFAADTKAMQQLVSARLNAAQKLNKLSAILPSGIWFTDLALSGKNFTLRGTAVSLKREEMSLINKFLDGLRSDADFFRGFNNLELGSWERNSIGGYEVIDFTFTGTLK